MAGDGFLLGFDVGSSSVKATLLDAGSGKAVASATSPKTELEIRSPRPGWAEQDPETWWTHAVAAAREIGERAGGRMAAVTGIGIAYQMHGLVLLDKAGQVLRPSIIWCDSRAVETGRRAFEAIGEKACLERLLNSPGNFTASKLAWVKENEPDVFSRVHKAMLPGDYLAWRMTGRMSTTPSGLSEMILWDFKDGAPADVVLRHYGIPAVFLPEVVPTFSDQGRLTDAAAAELGVGRGAVVGYRAGDQPNNAFSLKVLEPGEAAATAGTSGVVYGVGDSPRFDARSRVNSFLHVTSTEAAPRLGVLLCLNGTGSLYRWVRQLLAAGAPAGGAPLSYDALNALAARSPVGADGLSVLPYGNGAERTLDNANPGGAVVGLDFNRHGAAHLLRASQEGIVFALRHGLEIMAGMGMEAHTVRAGDANMFRSALFGECFASATGARVELFDTDGSQGAARGAGVGTRLYASPAEAFRGLAAVRTVEPRRELRQAYADAYGRWGEALRRILG